MDNINQKDLSSVLRTRGINIKKYENILNHIKLTYQNGRVEIEFPHKYFYELYKNELKNFVEQIYENNISYIINDHLKIQDIHTSDRQCQKNEYTFENYICGDNNKILLSICKEITQAKHVKYNPIVIYGESSSGKTHLVNSIITETKNKKTFIKDLFEIDQTISNHNLSEIYNNIIRHEITVIENINEIINEISGILLEKIIDHFYENNKQIIFTYKGKSLKPSRFPKSLYVRINSGLCIKLNNPDLNVRVIFTKRFCRDNKINLSSDNIFTISSNCDSIRSIKGILLKLTTLPEKSDLITTQHVNRLFEENGNNNHVDFKKILEAVSITTGHPVGDLLAMNRGKKISLARQMCMYLCKHKLNWSYPKIGSKFSGRDHSTVIYSVNKIEQLRKVNKETDSTLKHLFKTIDNLTIYRS